MHLLSDHVMMCLSTQTIEVSGPACFSVCYVVSGASQLICLLKILFVRTLLHDGSVDDRFDVVLPITGVDHPLSFRVLLHILLHKHPFEAHVRRHRLETEIKCIMCVKPHSVQ